VNLTIKAQLLNNSEPSRAKSRAKRARSQQTFIFCEAENQRETHLEPPVKINAPIVKQGTLIGSKTGGRSGGKSLSGRLLAITAVGRSNCPKPAGGVRFSERRSVSAVPPARITSGRNRSKSGLDLNGARAPIATASASEHPASEASEKPAKVH
jgi:hypothetical protein